MNHSSFNRRNLKPRKNDPISFLKNLFTFKKKNNRIIVDKKTNTKKAFRSPNKVAGLTERDIKKIIFKSLYLVLSVFVVLFVSWFLFSSQFFKIKTININLENQKYNDLINKLISIQKKESKLFWSQDNLFLFDKNDLIESINKVSSGFFYNVSLTKRFPNKITVNLEERSPKIVFITDEYKFYFDEDAKMILKVNKNNTNPTSDTPAIKKDEIKKESIVIKKEEVASNDEDLLSELIKNQIEEDNGVKVVDLKVSDNKIENNVAENKTIEFSGFLNKEDIFKDYNFPEVYIGQKIELKDADISKELIIFLTNINTKLPNKSINIKKIYLEVLTDYKIVVTTDVGYDIYFNSSKDIDQQIEYLGIVIKDKIKESIKNIKYIDLRFDSKIFYK